MMKHRRLTAAIVCALAALPALTAVPARAATVSASAVPGPVVHTRDGALRGTESEGYRTFQGVPYAAPPVGRLRWAAPRPVTPWAGTRDATRAGSACPQQAGEVPGGSTDEDCLHLNVTAPATASPARAKPVVVWLHGGGFTTGAGGSYDTHRMAVRGDVVVVTVNYRLGALGFLGLPGLADSGTFGLADQQAALRWVRANIAAFGGDAREVTLAGESAGGFSVCAQLASPSAAGLFDRAIIQSGPCAASPDRPFAPSAAPLETVRAAGTDLATAVGCGRTRPVLACLRRVSVPRLLAAQSVDQQPAYGTRLLPRDPGAALAAGTFHHVPVLVGGNHDEGNGWAAGIIEAGTPVTPDTWPDVVSAFVPDPARTHDVVRAYPVTTGSDGGPVFGAVIGDWNFSCPTLRTRALLQAARVPVWTYEFADEHAPPVTQSPPPFPLGAPHASELAYLFDLGGSSRAMTPAQLRLADTMIGYWTRFARTGSPYASEGPSSPGGPPAPPPWPHGAVQSLVPDRVHPIRPAAFAADHHCGFWATMS